jgi:hypothetical protein
LVAVRWKVVSAQPPAACGGFLAKYKTRLVEQHGAVVKEYVAILAELLCKPARLSPYLAASIQYVKSLKPKVGCPERPFSRLLALSPLF